MTAPSPARSWLLARVPQWRILNERIAELRRQPRLPLNEAQQALDGYRVLARDLSTARRLMPGSTITQGLESIYLAAHALVNRAPRHGWAALLELFRVQIPATVESLRTPLLYVVLLFVLSLGAGWWLISTYPDMIALVASQKMIDSVEHGRLWTQDLLNVTPSSVLSIRILSNNIVVSLMAFCAGLLFGLGTFYMIATNGLMLGAAFAFTRQHGLEGQLFSFIIAHGLVELSVICLAGAAGMALGESLVRPRAESRQTSFMLCARRLSRLLLPCALLLIGSGLIEGYVSPNPLFPLASRIVIGVSWWLLMFAALTGRLFGRQRELTPADAA